MFGLKIAEFCGKRFGLYTRKEMVRVCKSIGRELVDGQKSGVTYTKATLESTIKKHAPKVNVNIATTREEVKQSLLQHGVNEKEASQCIKMFDDAAGISYQHLDGDGKCKGIFTPIDSNLPSVLAHELEHYLFGQHSFISKLLPTRLIKNFSQSAHDIQKNMLEKIDLSETFMFREAIPLKDGQQNLFDFLKRFDRLESIPRIKAFFRGLCRNATHPQNKGAFTDIFSARQIIQDEQRAYGITDDIIRYAQGIPSGQKTAAGVFSDLLGYTDDILKQEQLTALTSCTVPKPLSHGCPSGTKELNEMELLFREIMRKKNAT